jgi:hypothetical protein
VSQPLDADSIAAALRQLGEGPAEDEVTVGELVARLEARGHSLALLLLAAPNLTPGPSMPGFSTIFGVPLCIVAYEVMVGRPHLRLPPFIARRSFRRGRIAAFVGHLARILACFEGVLRPRWHELAEHRGWVGAACLILGLLLILPIPVFSMLPAAAVLVIAMGRLARDGVIVAAGLALGVASLVTLGAIVWLALMALDWAG